MSSAWHPIDTHPLLSAADRDTVHDATQAAHQLDALMRAIPATLAAIRDSANGQPRAATTETSHAAPTAWCWDHQRELTRCLAEQLDCAGDVIDQPSDPVGEAAITDDRTTAHRNEIIRRLRSITRDVHELHAITALYPADPFEPASASGPGGDWCRSCWRDGQYHQPIDRDKDGDPYYAGLCRWCGDFNSKERFLPPVEILNHRHRGERVTEGMVAEARKAHRTQAKKVKKTKTRKKR